MEPVIADEIRRIAAGPLDWDFLLREAAENSVTPLVARHLPICSPETPVGVLEKLKASVRANAARSLKLTAELIALLDLLRSKDVLAIPYKGPVLAVQAYGDLTLREFQDLDIIVRQRDMPEVHKIMTGRGFRTNSPVPFSEGTPPVAISGEYIYRDEARGMDAPMPAEVRGRIHADLAATALARDFEARLLSRAPAPLGSAARFDLRRRMLAGKRAGWAYSLRLTLAPAQEDWSGLHLPRVLTPLYFLLRPLRLLRKYGLGRERPSQPS